MNEAESRGLRPPIRRSWLRLWTGKRWYAWRRFLLWHSGRFRFAKERQEASLPCSHFSHATPLLRDLQGAEMRYQHNKITNLRLAAARLDGILLRPGETFSFWRLVGKPTRRKGYLDGMVLFLGHVGYDVGGGLCQMTNLIFWMTLHTPLTVVERYRHSHDVFPDSNRTLPFGSGATCAYPHRDLMIRNDTDQIFQLRVRVGTENLEGEWLSENPPNFRYEVVERDHRMERGPWGGYIRHNELYRRRWTMGGLFLDEVFLLENNAVMMYNPLLPQSND